jgi:hypothetical protein
VDVFLCLWNFFWWGEELEIRSCYVAQCGLELEVLVPQHPSAEIIAMHHHTQLQLYF